VATGNVTPARPTDHPDRHQHVTTPTPPRLRLVAAALAAAVVLTGCATVSDTSDKKAAPASPTPSPTPTFVLRTAPRATPTPAATTPAPKAAPKKAPKPDVDGAITLQPRDSYYPSELFKTHTPTPAAKNLAADVKFVEGLWQGRVRITKKAAAGYVVCNTWQQDNAQHWAYQLRTTKKNGYGNELGLGAGELLLQVYRVKSARDDRTWVNVDVADKKTGSYVAEEQNQIEGDTDQNESNTMKVVYSPDSRSVAVDTNVNLFDDSFSNDEGLGVARVVARLRCSSIGSEEARY
jgi:hypothetical protein